MSSLVMSLHPEGPALKSSPSRLMGEPTPTRVEREQEGSWMVGKT